MNACLRELAAQIVAAFRAALAELGIEAPVYLSQNDGTLMGADYAERYPVATFASGPTNSMRGAALPVRAQQDCAVVDIGGTTSDVGVLQHGVPARGVRSRSRSAACARTSACRTSSRSASAAARYVRGDGPTIGPDSVGYELTSGRSSSAATR